MGYKIKLKKGDEVIVLVGKDKGKTGKITLIKPFLNKAIVSGINIKLPPPSFHVGGLYSIGLL